MVLLWSRYLKNKQRRRRETEELQSETTKVLRAELTEAFRNMLLSRLLHRSESRHRKTLVWREAAERHSCLLGGRCRWGFDSNRREQTDLLMIRICGLQKLTWQTLTYLIRKLIKKEKPSDFLWTRPPLLSCSSVWNGPQNHVQPG